MLARMSVRLRLVLGALCVLVLIAAAPFAYGYVTRYLKVGVGSSDNPLAYVTVVHRQLPPGQVPVPWIDRLEKQTGQDLGIVVRQDWSDRTGDGAYAPDAAFQDRLGVHAAVPAKGDYRVLGVATNVTSPQAVKRFGSFYAIWFQTPVDAESWLMADPTIFTDATAEKSRKTWWAGFYAFYYAPPTDGPDLTNEVDTWVRSVTGCPNGEPTCKVPDFLKTAGATPTP
jgi:hypothetical protein